MPKIRFTDDEKAKAVLRHFQDNVPISIICLELSLHPNVFYTWQKQLFSKAHIWPSIQTRRFSASMSAKLPSWRGDSRTRTTSSPSYWRSTPR